MIMQETDSAYPTDIPALNEYLIESHVQLVQHITGLLQDHSMHPVAMDYLSPDPYSFPISFPTDIPSQGPNLVPTSTQKSSTSDLPLIFSSSFPLNISSETPISGSPYDTIEYQHAKFSSSSLPSSRLPSTAPQKVHLTNLILILHHSPVCLFMQILV